MSGITARELALKVLTAVLEEGAYANLALNKVLERYRPAKLDRAFATELAYGALRALNTLDWVLAQFVSRPLDVQPPAIRNILRLGAYQLLYMPRVPPPAVCNEGTELAKKYGHAGLVKFVNGVLRNIARSGDKIKFPPLEQKPVEHISLCYWHPPWLVERWLAEYGLEETVNFCRANNTPAPNTVRTNTLKIDRESLARLLEEEEGLSVEKAAFAPEGLHISNYISLGSLKSFREGLFTVQDESSMLAARALSPTPGAFVIDACSAPGGKTTHLAELMKNTGRIVASDIYRHKLALVEENCARLGITIVEPLEEDARNLGKMYTERADFVLVDAPCSGLGVLRRRPDARWRKEPGQIAELTALQSEILESASRCLKPGGVMVYCTCTVTQEENLGQVKNFLAKHSEFGLDSLVPFLPSSADVEGTLSDGYLQLYPHRQGTDGFFIARLLKKARGEYANR